MFETKQKQIKVRQLFSISNARQFVESGRQRPLIFIIILSFIKGAQ